MKRHASLQLLSQEHINGLITANLIKKNCPENPKLPNTIPGKKNYTIRYYQDEMIRHFLDEEKILFPVVKGMAVEIDKLIDELIEEHRKIEFLIDKLLTQDNVENILNLLGVTLEVHIKKEEMILFSKIQELLSENELDKIGKIFAKTHKSKDNECL